MGTDSIIKFVDLLFEVLVWLVIIRCLLSFINHDPSQPIIRFVYEITEPVMGPFRKIIPSTGGIDFSPIIAVLAIEAVRSIVYKLLMLIL